MSDPILAEHKKMAAAHPKLYYRDSRVEWADQAEGRALHHEAAAFTERSKPGGDETVADRHADLARQWRLLIKN